MKNLPPLLFCSVGWTAVCHIPFSITMAELLSDASFWFLVWFLSSCLITGLMSYLLFYSWVFILESVCIPVTNFRDSLWLESEESSGLLPLLLHLFCCLLPLLDEFTSLSYFTFPTNSPFMTFILKTVRLTFSLPLTIWLLSLAFLFHTVPS